MAYPEHAEDVADAETFQNSDRRNIPAAWEVSEKLPNVSSTVSFCISKAIMLAKQLNHPETTVAHFIVAMTLQPDAPEWFKRRHFDVQSAWRSAMGILIDLKRVNNPLDSPPAPSNELKSIVNTAQQIGINRENQDAVVDDILSIFYNMPASDPARQVISGDRPTTPAEDALDAVRNLEASIGHRFDHLASLLSIHLEQQQTAPPDKTTFRGTISDMFGLSQKTQRK
jgi:ATP-dependent Clp protease ATP-binding subunit ClpA